MHYVYALTVTSRSSHNHNPAESSLRLGTSLTPPRHHPERWSDAVGVASTQSLCVTSSHKQLDPVYTIHYTVYMCIVHYHIYTFDNIYYILYIYYTIQFVVVTIYCTMFYCILYIVYYFVLYTVQCILLYCTLYTVYFYKLLFHLMWLHFILDYITYSIYPCLPLKQEVE